MSASALPNCCRCAVEVWQASGERTKARLNDLVKHYATSNGLTEILPDLQKETIASVPSWKFADQ